MRNDLSNITKLVMGHRCSVEHRHGVMRSSRVDGKSDLGTCSRPRYFTNSIALLACHFKRKRGISCIRSATANAEKKKLFFFVYGRFMFCRLKAKGKNNMCNTLSCLSASVDNQA